MDEYDCLFYVFLPQWNPITNLPMMMSSYERASLLRAMARPPLIPNKMFVIIPIFLEETPSSSYI